MGRLMEDYPHCFDCQHFENIEGWHCKLGNDIQSKRKCKNYKRIDICDKCKFMHYALTGEKKCHLQQCNYTLR